MGRELRHRWQEAATTPAVGASVDAAATGVGVVKGRKLWRRQGSLEREGQTRWEDGMCVTDLAGRRVRPRRV